jgi:quercetin dioxygenase-like cupin family protein
MANDPRGTPDVRTDLFGGSGTVRVWNLVRPGHPAPAPFSAVLFCRLDPGGRVGHHRQEHDNELVIGVSGEGRATVDGETHALLAQALVPLSLGSVLAIENLSASDPLEYLIVKAVPRPG